MKNLLTALVLSAGLAILLPMGVAQTTPTVTGKWHFMLATDGGDRAVEAVFQQDGDQVSGKWGAGDVKGTFIGGKLNLEFPMTSDEGGAGTVKIKGQLANDALSGDWFFNDYSGSFKATRAK